MECDQEILHICDFVTRALSSWSADPPFQELLSQAEDIFCVTAQGLH